jgi:hypothetical protein
MGSDATGPLVPTGYLPRDLRAIEVNMIYRLYTHLCIVTYVCVYIVIYFSRSCLQDTYHETSGLSR